MFLDILLLIVAIFFILAGLAGCILPVIPGPPLSFIGLLLLRFTDFLEPHREAQFDTILWITASAAIVAVVLDYFVPIWGTKRYGGSRAGTLGATFGLIAGLFFGPVGIIAGPFIGAVAGEMLSGKDQRSSFRSGFGSLMGFFTGIVLKLIVSGIITYYFIKEIFIG